VLTERELLFQQQILNIHARVGQLPPQLFNYSVLDSSIRQDSVMALGFAVTHRHRAHNTPSGGRINRSLVLTVLHDEPRPGKPRLIGDGRGAGDREDARGTVGECDPLVRRGRWRRG